MQSRTNEQRRPLQGLRNLASVIAYSIRHAKTLRVRQSTQAIKNTLMLVNLSLGKMEKTTPLYVQRVNEFDRVMVELIRAKWATSQAMQSNDSHGWKRTTALLKQTKSLADSLHGLVASGSREALVYEPIELDMQDTEILFADGAPLIPSINPIIVLQGSDYEMGYQYAQQLVEIFGKWILERKANVTYSQEEMAVMACWEEEIEQHAPEFIPFFHGWAAGATADGIEMSYHHVLDMWTGHRPPAIGYIGENGLPDLGHPLCSGLAAWGRATTDGKLVTGSSGDHDMGHTVTVVAFPVRGNNYIFAPFGADGGVPAAGPLYFFGHPGMNDKGLAYVHHGGGPKMIEPKETWGYGIRRAISVLHILRFCNNIEQAREMELSFPVGEAGMGDPATAGGFYADSTGAFSIESKVDPLIIRESGVLGETDFLYATNAPMHPDVKVAPWMQAEPDNWTWAAPGGWRPKQFKEFNLHSMENPHLMGMKWGWFSAFQRNQQAFEALNQRVGKIDIQAMQEIYRTSGSTPDGDWKVVSKAYAEEKWSPAVGNSSNALMVIMKPDDGVYMHCVGEASRGLAPMSAKNSSPLYDETNAFWEINLGGSLADMVNHAHSVAETNVAQGLGLLNENNLDDKVMAHLQELMQVAQAELARGNLYHSQSNDVYARARALRAFTRAQVRAQQVVHVV